MIVPESGRMLDTSEWSPIIDELLQGQHFVITTHENSDGDGLGSEVALATVLQALGKQVRIVNPTEVPPNYLFLKKLYPITLFDNKSEEAIQELSLCDVVILLDANLRDRMGKLWPHVGFSKELGALKILCIDHHLEPEDLQMSWCAKALPHQPASLFTGWCTRFRSGYPVSCSPRKLPKHFMYPS